MVKASAATARKLARLSTDCSFLLTHMIRQNGASPRSDAEARSILLSILGIEPKGAPILRASGVGWYSVAANCDVFDPHTNDFKRPGESRAVCFTESTLTGLRAHRDVFHVRYGLSFDRDHLFSVGANPCLNIRDDMLKADVHPASGRARKLFNYVPQQLLPFINVVNTAFDATHEREWRYADDLSFQLSDVRIVFCPEDEFQMVSVMQEHGKPVLFDLKWLDRV